MIAWSAVRPGGHDDTTRSVIPSSLPFGFTQTPKKERLGLRRMVWPAGRTALPSLRSPARD